MLTGFVIDQQRLPTRHQSTSASAAYRFGDHSIFFLDTVHRDGEFEFHRGQPT
jgi:hypothetical protein